MPEGSFELSSRRVLEPVDRVSEVLFGLIMVLTFTGSLSVAEAGRDDVRTMLIGALGCNLAWGMIDGVLYLMGCLAEKGRGLLTVRAVRDPTDPTEEPRRASPARLQCHGHRDVVFDGPRLRTHDRASPVAGGYFDGYSGVDSRGHNHGAGRMRRVRALAFLAIVVVLAGDNALAGVTTSTAPALSEEAEEKAWSFSASVSTYILPNDQEYVQPTLTADRGWLHLETRYNYENLETGSVWVGYNFSGGEKLQWDFTPILGGVFGNTTRIPPGYKLSLTYWKIELSSEGEFVFDTGNSEGNFFYNWSELSVSPVDWFRFGLVGQRTRAYQADVDIQRGLLVGFSYKKMDFTTYVFNLVHGKQTWVFAVGVSF